MKLITTRVVTEEITIKPSGRTIGETVNDLVAHDTMPDEIVTNIVIEVTTEDRIALRMLRGPIKPPFTPSTKLRREDN